jgi:hypothetical protein
MSDVVDSSKVILTVEYKDEGIKQVIPIELLFNNHIIAHFKPRDAKSGGMNKYLKVSSILILVAFTFHRKRKWG